VKENDLVFALGPAGTGKTFVSVALAVRALKNKAVKKKLLPDPPWKQAKILGFCPAT